MRSFKANYEGESCSFFFCYVFFSQITAGSIVAVGRLVGLCGFTLGFKFFSGTKTFIGFGRIQKFFCSCNMVCIKVGLEIWPFVPVNAQPFHSINNSLDGFLSGAISIGIFNAEDQFSACFFCIEPVVKCCSGTAYMKIPCRAGWKTKSCFCHEKTCPVVIKRDVSYGVLHYSKVDVYRF